MTESNEISLPQPIPSEVREDERALGETIGFAKNIDLESREAQNKINALERQDGLERHLSRVMVTGLWVAGAGCLAMFLVLVAHKVRPGIWLTHDEVADLQGFLLSGTLGGFLATGAKKFLGEG